MPSLQAGGLPIGFLRYFSSIALGHGLHCQYLLWWCTLPSCIGKLIPLLYVQISTLVVFPKSF
jgi:hypothetical protein